MAKQRELMPQEELTLSFYDQVADQWVADHDRPGYWKLEMDLFHQLLPGGRILEIGAGGGRDAKELLDLGYQYVGTDISSGLLQLARQALPSQTFLQQSVYDLTFEQEFDGFWASAVLLHIPRLRMNEALSQIRKTQRLGGIGFISLKDGRGERIEVETVDGRELGRHFSYWTRQEFEPYLNSSGFRVIDYIYHPKSARTRWHSLFVKAV